MIKRIIQTAEHVDVRTPLRILSDELLVRRAYRVSNSQESVASPVDLAILEALVPRLNRRKKDSDYEEKFREDEEEEVVKEFIQETEASL